MKSQKLHNLLALLLLPLLLQLDCAWSKPMNIEPGAEQPMILIKNNVDTQDLENYKIVHDAKGQPCLTISWKTNPDGSGPDDPKIYMVDGYFKVLQPDTYKPQ